jgi:hypothetical protein
MPGYYLKISHVGLLPNPFQSIIHFSFIRRYIAYVTENTLLNKLQINMDLITIILFDTTPGQRTAISIVLFVVRLKLTCRLIWTPQLALGAKSLAPLHNESEDRTQHI